MIERMRFPASVLVIGALVLAALVGWVLFAGCGKRQPPAGQVEQMPTHQHAPAPQAKTATEQKPVTAAGEQTTCPIMGGAINKAIFVEYQGKKVYFCCPGCPDAFKANPQKYVAKLPQFQE